MSLRRLKTLLAIAELGTFADAAQAVHLTPAAVGQQMKSLEEELGVALFDRTRRPPELNPAGHTLIPRARALIRAYEDLAPSLLGEVSTVEQLVIGAVLTTMTGLMPLAMKTLRETHDKLHIRVYPALSEELYAQVDRGFLDAAVLSEPPSLYDHLNWQPFAAEPMVVLAPPDASYDDPMMLLEGYPYIRFSRRAWVGKAIDAWLRKRGLRVQEVMELDTLESIAAMVYNGVGVSILPKNCVATPNELDLKQVELDDSLAPRVLGVLSRRDAARSNLVNILRQKLLHIVEDAGRVPVIRGQGS